MGAILKAPTVGDRVKRFFTWRTRLGGFSGIKLKRLDQAYWGGLSRGSGIVEDRRNCDDSKAKFLISGETFASGLKYKTILDHEV